MAITNFRGDYDFLSNFYLSDIKMFGYTFKNSEGAFQAGKNSDVEYRKALASVDMKSGRKVGIEVKKMGRRTQLTSNWEFIKDGVMFNALLIKFSDSYLKAKLINTGDEYLIEGNHWDDNYWGNCHCEKCKNINGKNRLGIYLMRVRSYYRQELGIGEII